MCNLRSDSRALVADLPPGDVMRAHVERLCLQIDLLEERWHKANQRITAIREALQQIVITKEPDAGVLLKDCESPTEFNRQFGCHVYLNEHFSEMGHALVKLHQMCVIE